MKTIDIFQQKSSKDIIEDLNKMACKITTLIMCSPKNKELLEEIKDELPPMTKIVSTSHLEDDKIYLITDERMIQSIAEAPADITLKHLINQCDKIKPNFWI